MNKELSKLQHEAEAAIQICTGLKDLEALEVLYFGRRDGQLNSILKGLKELSEDDRRALGAAANEVKTALLASIEAKRAELKSAGIGARLASEWLDPSLPSPDRLLGHLHPLTIIQSELEDLFRSLGFMILDGPELESDYFNFEALNIPLDHPARDMQDTFYVKTKTSTKEKLVMRPHTSNVQVRAMREYGAPLRAVVPGRCFRYEASDASHDHTFYQMEGVMIDKNITIANLIAVMKTLLKGIFKREVKVRLRPGFFPFVEPGFELDINCLICGGKGCSVCKQSGWVELLPCGMIHTHVLKAGNLDPNVYSGFAFGLGLTRLVMMRYGIEDIRLLFGNDIRFLQQF
jgi:phenylalanyl-tRNA synthetase alpha chain